MPEKKQNSQELTANEFVNVKDIHDIFLYTRDNYIFCYLRIYPFNLDLLSEEERRVLTNRLAAAFDGDRKDFVYFTLPRELDLDKYKNFLKEKRLQEMESLGKKHIIDELIRKATDLSSNHENYEHQHAYKIWMETDQYVSKSSAESQLRERIARFRDIYNDVQIKCEILAEREIIKLCNLYSNNRSAGYDAIGSTLQPEIPIMR